MVMSSMMRPPSVVTHSTIILVSSKLPCSIRPTSLRSSSHEEASTSGSSSYEFTYTGSDGRKKATFEQAFKSDVRPFDPAVPPAPWEVGYQMSEKNLAWNNDLKARLLARVVAEKLSLSEEELDTRLERLQALLPDIKTKLPNMRPTTIVELVKMVDILPERLMAIKTTFPGANASKLAMRAPDLVLGFDPDHIADIAAQLRQMLPSVDVDKLVEENPSMLDIEELRCAMAEAARIMPTMDIVGAMRSDPQLILSFQRGSQLIPYDPPTPEVEREMDDDEYAQYYR